MLNTTIDMRAVCSTSKLQ